MLERAVTLCTSGTISGSDLNLRQGHATEDSPAEFTATDLGNQVEDVQRQAIMDALEKTRFNKTAAAKLLVFSSEPGATHDFVRLLRGLPGLRLEGAFAGGQFEPGDLAPMARLPVDGDASSGRTRPDPGGRI